MRTRWVGALLGLGLILAAMGTTAPAPAGAASPAVADTPVGTLDYLWTGDPARGCAAAGVCGVVGSLQVITGGTTDSSSPGPPPIDLQDQTAAARVVAPALDGTSPVCADLVPYSVQFVLRRRGGRLRAVAQGISQPASAGQCAGPTAADLQSVALPARKLGRGYDLAGTVSAGAGPFAVTVISTIHVLFVSSSSLGLPAPPPPGPAPRPPRPRAALAEQADVRYRVSGVSGRLTTSFAGLGQPLCAPLDACGVTGALDLVPADAGATLDFSGSRLVKRRVGARRALADLRAGRLRLAAGPGGAPPAGALTGTVTGTLAGGTVMPCHDTVAAAPLGLEQTGTGSAAFRLTLGPSGSGPVFYGTTDELRTHCPGPGSPEILGARPLAGATVPVHAVGSPRLTLVLSGAGPFHSAAYAGSRSGSITLSLVRTRQSGATRRVHVIGGQVF